jgi:hypothetical protein
VNPTASSSITCRNHTASPETQTQGELGGEPSRTPLTLFIRVTVVTFLVMLVVHATVFLSWAVAIYSELVVPLAVVMLIWQARPSWTNFHRRGGGKGRELQAAAVTYTGADRHRDDGV